MHAKLTLSERIKLIRRVLAGEPVARVCEEAGISRTLFYRWMHRYKKEAEKVSALVPKVKEPEWKAYEKLSPLQRFQIIERAKNNGNVDKVCKDAGISRTIFYKWLKRYNEASEGKKLEALWDKKPIVEKYYRQTPEEYEQVVLAAVREYPELSTHKLVEVLPKIGDKPILGNHGVQNVLERHNLTTFQQRAAFAADYHSPSPATDFFGVFQYILDFIVSQNPSLRVWIIRGGFVSGLALFVFTIIYGSTGLFQFMVSGDSIGFSIGVFFSLLSLFCGTFFFLYSIKYYITIAMVLSFSRHGTYEEIEQKSGTFIDNVFGIKSKNSTPVAAAYHALYKAGGLQQDLDSIKLTRKPFVSIHLATYNEKRVVDRLLTAATAMEYENYEVVIVDDSNDESIQVLEKWKHHPRVKIIHRENRSGYKGGALTYALGAMNPKAEFILIFDADFIPYPDSITQFLKYMQSMVGSLSPAAVASSSIAAIQGYQWHVLNKSENWITRGVRSEYSGSYVIERSGEEIYKGLKQIAGSVYMMRADVIKKIGWGTSITEDFELTLRLYEKGYKVVYTPYIQAPAEAVSTIKRLIRQRMRWAEGHSYNTKRMFKRLMFGSYVANSKLKTQNSKLLYAEKDNNISDSNTIDSRNSKSRTWRKSPLTVAEKFEFLYLSPYYLQATFFMVGTFCWFLAEVVFQVRLPFWTEVWGWSLILTNMLALPLVNLVGLFLEEAEEKDYLGLFSFVALSYIVAPFQAYASVKGFIEKEEGPWFRTPKTGRITDVFTPGRFYRYIFGMFGKNVSAGLGVSEGKVSHIASFATQNVEEEKFTIHGNRYLALATSNNRFGGFGIKRKKRGFVSHYVLVTLLLMVSTLIYYSYFVPQALAATIQNLYLNTATPPDTPAVANCNCNYMNGTAPSASAGVRYTMQRNKANSGTINYTWYSDILPNGGGLGNAILGTGQYIVNIVKSSGSGSATSDIINVGMQIFVSNANGAAQNQLMGNIARIRINNADNAILSYNVGNITTNYEIPNSNSQRVALRLFFSAATNGATDKMNILVNNSSAIMALVVPDFRVPEIPIKAIEIAIYAILPILPTLARLSVKKGRRKKNLIDEIVSDWKKIFYSITGCAPHYIENRV